MSRDDDTTRVLIALTEASPVDRLWKVALDLSVRKQAEVTALYFAEYHWQRAASLPFTREISRLSGANVDFTLNRARQIHEESIDQARKLVDKLAADAKLPHAFEVLGESDRERFRELVTGTGVVLIAPSFFIQRPIYVDLEKLDCRIELVEVSDQDD